MGASKVRFISLGGKYARGRKAIVDAEDFEKVNQWNWFVCPNDYLISTHSDRLRMHHLIIGVPDGFEVDHINRNTLDNRKCNLRLATRTQQLQNRSGWGEVEYKGVCRRGRRYRASISVEKRFFAIGQFDTPELAAIAYDAYAHRVQGEFACLNFPDRQPLPCESVELLKTHRRKTLAIDLIEEHLEVQT